MRCVSVLICGIFRTLMQHARVEESLSRCLKGFSTLQTEWNTVRSALRCIECYKQGFMFLDLADPEAWQILYVSPEAVDQTGGPARRYFHFAACCAANAA